MLLHSPHYCSDFTPLQSTLMGKEWEIGNWLWCVRVCVCVCVIEREREGEREDKQEKRPLLALLRCLSLCFCLSLCADVIRQEKEFFVFPRGSAVDRKMWLPIERLKRRPCVCEFACVGINCSVTHTHTHTPGLLACCAHPFPLPL